MAWRVSLLYSVVRHQLSTHPTITMGVEIPSLQCNATKRQRGGACGPASTSMGHGSSHTAPNHHSNLSPAPSLSRAKCRGHADGEKPVGKVRLPREDLVQMGQLRCERIWQTPHARHWYACSHHERPGVQFRLRPMIRGASERHVVPPEHTTHRWQPAVGMLREARVERQRHLRSSMRRRYSAWLKLKNRSCKAYRGSFANCRTAWTDRFRSTSMQKSRL